MALNAVERPDVTTLEPESNNNPETDSGESVKNVSEQRVKRKLSNCIDENNVKKHKLCSSSSDEDAIASSEDSNIHLLKEMQINRSKNIICSSNEENGVEEPDSEIKLPEKVHSEGSSLNNDVLPLMKIRENMKNPIVLIEKLETKSAILSSSDSENDSSSKRNHHSKVQSKSPTTASSSESDESDSEVIGLRKKPMQRAKDEDSCNEGDEDASLMNERNKFGQEEENSEKMSVGSGSNDSGDESLDLKKKKIMSKAALLQSDEDESSRDKVEDSSSVKKKEKGSKKENKVLKKPEMSVGSDSNDSDDETLEFKKEKNKKSNYKAKLLQSDEDESSCDKEGYSSSAKKKRRGTSKGNKLMKNTEKISVGSDSSDSNDEPLGLKKEKSQKSNFKAKLLQSDEDESSCDMEGDISSAKKNRRGTKKENKLTKKTEKISEGSDSSDSDDEPLGLKKEKSQKSNFKAKLLQSDEDESSCNMEGDISSAKKNRRGTKKENKLTKKTEKISERSDSSDSDDEPLGLKKEKSQKSNFKAKLLQSDEDESSCDMEGDISSAKKNRRGTKKENKLTKKTEKISEGSDSSDSDDEPLGLKKEKSQKSNFKAKLLQSDQDENSCDNVEKRSLLKNQKKDLKKENKLIEKKKQVSVSSENDDSESDIQEFKKKKSSNMDQRIHSDEDGNSGDAVEDNPIQNENGKINSKDTKSEEIPEKMSVGSDSNDSDDETLDLKKKKSNFKAKLQQSDEDESSCDKVEDSKSITKNRKGSKKENKPLEKTEKISVKSDSSDSDNETLDLKKEKSKRGNFKNKQLHSDEDENSCDTVEDISSKKKKKDSKKENKYTEKTEKVKKTSPASNNRIEHLKKYVRAAGIRVPCYSKLFEKCKSQKSKVEKILELLHKQGLKGKPTLEKCKKLRKRIETRKEFAELDQANIIQSEGRRKRGTTDETIDKKPVKTPPPKKIFSRLKDIFDSEESD